MSTTPLGVEKGEGEGTCSNSSFQSVSLLEKKAKFYVVFKAQN
jgi:hypothetical protein